MTCYHKEICAVSPEVEALYRQCQQEIDEAGLYGGNSMTLWVESGTIAAPDALEALLPTRDPDVARQLENYSGSYQLLDIFNWYSEMLYTPQDVFDRAYLLVVLNAGGGTWMVEPVLGDAILPTSGDVNWDGSVTITDVIQLSSALMGGNALTALERENADCFQEAGTEPGDVVDSKDTLALMKYLVRITDTLPVAAEG